MSFLNPGWLGALAALPLVYVLLAIDDRQRRARFARFARETLWRFLAPELDPRARMCKARIWLLALGFVILALARPQWGSHEETLHVTGLDILVALDVSNSMETEDVVPSRLKKAKHLIRTLIDQLHGDRVGLVAFAGSASVACPLTTDTEYFWEAVQIMSPRLVPNQGTDIGLALDRAQASLDRGGEGPAGAPAEKAAPADANATHAIVLISDGEDHEGGAVEIARKLSSHGTKLFVLGVGTQKGGPIPLRDENGTLQGYKRERSGQPVVSQFHPEALTELASAAGGRYWNVTPGEGEVQELVAELGELKRGDQAERTFVIREDRFQYPLAVAILLLLFELSLPARRLGVAAAVAAVVLLGGGARPARAEPLRPYLENEEGLKSYREGKLSEARQHFGAAQALEPGAPELHYNEGIVQLQEGQLDDAVRAFGEAAQGAGARGDAGLAGRSYFNLGITASKKKDVKGAIHAYLGAIDAARAAHDSKLEADARKNLELLVQQQQQQKQQQQQQDQKQGNEDQKQDQNQQSQQDKEGGSKDNQKGSGKDDKPEDKKDQKKDPDEGKDKDKEKEKKNPHYRDDSESQRKPFRSQKMSDEDAERVMAELKNRERELQMKMKRQNANNNPNPKDW